MLKLTTAVFLVKAPVDVTTWMNPPASMNAKAFYVTEGKNFDNVMNAIKSHSVPVDTPDGEVEVMEVGLILERKAD